MSMKLPWPEGRMSAREAAPYLGVTLGTLNVWRCTRRYPIPYTKVGNKIFYQKRDLDEFLASMVLMVGRPQRTDDEGKLSEHANQIETLLIDQLKAEKYHSTHTLESLIRGLRLSRNELREAVNELVTSGRLIEEELPDSKKRGPRLTFLCPKGTIFLR